MKLRIASWRTWPLLLAVGWSCGAQAFTVDITPQNPRAIYLRVGDGAFSNRSYRRDGIPADLATVNRVAVTLAPASVGSGTALAMTGNATQLTSNYDDYVFCNAGQIYVGGFYRRNGSGDNATLSVSVPAALTNAGGDTIPFSQISWSSSGNGDGAATQPVPAGSFVSGAVQTLATFPVNSWRESCLSFRYGNANVVAAGTYTGQVTYTLAAP